MSKNVAMFVDVANMYYAARGQDVDVDYVALLKHATKGRDLIRAYAYTGLDPENENQRKFIDFLAKNGYKPVVKDIRKFGDGRMKANLDIELVVDLFRLADRMDIAVIVSGDGDFAPAIKALQDKGVRCEVISFKPNTSSDLIAVADEFMDIMKVASISRKEARATLRSMGAPEMPAKEVSPEFGFREASPSVAAAALAALKTGSPADGGRSRRGTRRPAAAPTADEAPLSVVAASPAESIAEGDEGTRRRRRRRGGRGRGRGRQDEPTDATEPTAAREPGAAGEEIGWEEFDDLAQLDGTPDEEREFSFSEADPETLAELGLSPEEAAAMAGAPTSEADAPEEKPKTRRRTSTKKADAPADEKPKTARRRTTATKSDQAESEAAGDEKPKARRRATTKKADAPTDADAPTEDKPKTTRRRSTTKKADQAGEEAAGDGEPQGIWGRFRSARKPRESSND